VQAVSGHAMNSLFLEDVPERPRAVLLRSFAAASRPVQLIKTIAAVGWGQYCANGNHVVLDGTTLPVLAGMVLLWAGLYSINDLADAGLDRTTVHKRFRPLAAGRLQAPELISVCGVEIVLALVLLAAAGRIALWCAAIQILNQLVYSLEPLRLKRRFLLD